MARRASRRVSLPRKAERGIPRQRVLARSRTRKPWRLDRDVNRIRKEFPTLDRGIYLISNSLGAVPRAALAELKAFYDLWESEGVTAWEKAWWGLGERVGDLAAETIGARPGTVTMTANATQAHWAALSTRFRTREGSRRTKIVLSDQDFPSVIYAVREISRALGWKPVVVPSRGRIFDPGPLLEAIDDRTLFVATSHVHYKTAYVQDVRTLCRQARRRGALSLIDGYHAPGVMPVEVEDLGADFYVGGCLKWLCGGPGTAFLYVRPGTDRRIRPALTGWAAHRHPFGFDLDMKFAEDSRRFQSGTPAVPCLYTARAGLEMIKSIGPERIREKSLKLTARVLERAGERGHLLLTPTEDARRGGHVAFSVPHALAVKLALEERGVKTDFRKGGPGEPDILRVGPHFYNTEDEIETLFREMDEILSTGKYKTFLRTRVRVT